MTAANARKLFGTDGIRAVAGEYPLDAATIYAAGLALGHSLRKTAAEPKVILGRDTRESGPWIAATLAAGLIETGVRVESAGVVPTPAVAFLARTHGFQAGVVISASHNPWQDNGIKLFGADGYKLADAVELAMEEEILHHAANSAAPDPSTLPAVEDNAAFQTDYIQFLLDCVPGLSLDGVRIVADCANGAAAAVAPRLFRRLGGEVTLLNVAPDGHNINLNCGALHPKQVAAEVAARGADLGLTFDGDADRCMLAGSHNNVINGDAILLIAARDLKERGLLTGDLVVATTMSNMGLEAALRRSGIAMLRAQVGDRYVLELMREHGCTIGGEPSGHIILSDYNTTGDGFVAALQVLAVVRKLQQPVSVVCHRFDPLPQVTKNVRYRNGKPHEDATVRSAITSATERLNGHGRVIVRPSGTEPVIRITGEGDDPNLVEDVVDGIVEAVTQVAG